MTGLHDIQIQLNQAAGIIGGFRHSVVNGKTVDLAGLDHAIEEVCNAVATLPPDERITLKGTLITLIDEMDALVKSLETQQQSISDDLKGVSSRQRAVSAYGKGVTTGNHPADQPANQTRDPETK